MGYSYPSEYQDPWYEIFANFVNAIDTSIYALREDNHLVVTGGGTFSLTIATDMFEWSEDIVIVNLLNGATRTISASGIVITGGDVVYVELSRPITGVKTLTAAKATSVGSDQNKFWIGFRKANNVYLRTNQIVAGS
jgi:hypothetical protein